MMLRHTKKIVVFIIFIINSQLASATGVLELYFSFIAKDEGTIVDAMSDWFEIPESRVGQTVSLYRAVANGGNPGTHLILARFPDYASYEALADRQAQSEDWAQMLRTFAVASKDSANGIVVQKASYGSGGSNQQYAWAVIATVSDSGKFMKAFDRYQKSATAEKRPAESRLMHNRAGDSADTYIIVETANSFTELSEYHDLREASDDFARFQRDSKGTYKTHTTELYRLVKT